MFAEFLFVDATGLSHLCFRAAFKNTKLQFIVALKEINVMFFLPYLEKEFLSILSPANILW